MLATYTLTQTIALLLGLYLLAAGIGLLTDSKAFAGVLDEFKSSIGLTYIAAIAAFAIGAVLVAIHNLWATPLQIIVSLVGWAALFEGLLMLAFRRPFFTLVGAIPLNANVMKAYGVFVLVLGTVLIAMVFI
ncbi:MAG: hypothetical protein WBD01_13360 [Salaquimonas sp.]